MQSPVEGFLGGAQVVLRLFELADPALPALLLLNASLVGPVGIPSQGPCSIHLHQSVTAYGSYRYGGGRGGYRGHPEPALPQHAPAPISNTIYGLYRYGGSQRGFGGQGRGRAGILSQLLLSMVGVRGRGRGGCEGMGAVWV